MIEIFEKLDSDKDGKISAGKYDEGPIGEHIAKAFKPLFIELDIL